MLLDDGFFDGDEKRITSERLINFFSPFSAYQINAELIRSKFVDAIDDYYAELYKITSLFAIYFVASGV